MALTLVWLSLYLAIALHVVHCGAAADGDVGFQSQDDEQFLRWCSEFYPELGADEMARIYPTWRENADYVRKTNSLRLSYTLTTNKFTHLVSKDWLKQVCWQVLEYLS